MQKTSVKMLFVLWDYNILTSKVKFKIINFIIPGLTTQDAQQNHQGKYMIVLTT